jgi:signal transduction histidine kinase
VLSSITVLMTVALLAGWIWVISENLPLTRAFSVNRWLLAGGVVSFVLVVSGRVRFSVSLVREILEGRRQQVFIDSVTHELKSPLASIKLCVETLARPGLSSTQQAEVHGMMGNSLNK